jgi:hypothetical protein
MKQNVLLLKLGPRLAKSESWGWRKQNFLKVPRSLQCIARFEKDMLFLNSTVAQAVPRKPCLRLCSHTPWWICAFVRQLIMKSSHWRLMTITLMWVPALSELPHTMRLCICLHSIGDFHLIVLCTLPFLLMTIPMCPDSCGGKEILVGYSKN